MWMEGNGGPDKLPPGLALLGGEQQRSQLCLNPKQKPACAAGSLSTSPRPLQHQHLATEQRWRPSGAQKLSQPCSHTWLALCFVPGRCPSAPGSALLGLSRAAKALLVFPSDSLARRLSPALRLALTVGHPKGISAGCSAGPAGHQGTSCSRATLPLKTQMGNFLPASLHRITESQNSRGWQGPLWVI